MLDSIITNDRVVDRNALEVVVLCIVGFDETVRDVWDIKPSVTLASDVSVEVLHLERIDEVAPETHELLC